MRIIISQYLTVSETVNVIARLSKKDREKMHNWVHNDRKTKLRISFDDQSVTETSLDGQTHFESCSFKNDILMMVKLCKNIELAKNLSSLLVDEKV